jgi:hypothetical protein
MRGIQRGKKKKSFLYIVFESAHESQNSNEVKHRYIREHKFNISFTFFKLFLF